MISSYKLLSQRTFQPNLVEFYKILIYIYISYIYIYIYIYVCVFVCVFVCVIRSITPVKANCIARILLKQYT